jgi:hypothetical protein
MLKALIGLILMTSAVYGQEINNKPVVTIVLSLEEANALRTLIDLAVKGQGMTVAGFAVMMDGKIVQAAKEAQAKEQPK